MPVREIVQFPDARLQTPASAVARFDADLRRVADELAGTLAALSAIGVTGPHVGAPVRLYVLRLPDWPAPRLYANARIASASADTQTHREGSVSMPGIVEDVERAARVCVEYQDLDGNAHAEEADGFLAACHQHEIDQLDGIFWLQRVSRLRRERAIKRFRKLRSERSLE